MAEMTEQQEAAALNARSSRRQNKAQPWLIRDDGQIFPNVPLLAKRKNMRVFTGDIKAPLEERMRYLQGLPGKRRVVFDEVPPLNITKASKEELIAFAFDEHSEVIEPSEHINKVRALICKLEDLDYNEIFGGGKASAGKASESTGLQPPAGA
jgi:hypothetical protein